MEKKITFIRDGHTGEEYRPEEENNPKVKESEAEDGAGTGTVKD